MPCEKCRHILYFYEKEPVCPKCNSLAVLDSATAIEVSNRRLEYVKKLWEDYIRTLDKESLLAWVTWEREKYSRLFFQRYGTLDLGKLLAYTLMLKRTMQLGKVDGKTIIDNEETAKKLTDTFEKLSEIEVDHLHLKSCYSNMLYLDKFDDVKNLTPKQLVDDFVMVQNEKFITLMKTYENHDIFTVEEAEKRLQQYQTEFADILNQPIQEKKKYTTEEFVKRFYNLILTMYGGLLKNRLYAETFDLTVYGKLFINPVRLMEFVNSFAIMEGCATVCNTKEFMASAEQFFRQRSGILAKILLFDETNPSIFPLFVRVRKDSLDYVFISHAFSHFIYIMLHAVLRKDLFNAETEQRSKEFEKNVVKKEFEKNSFAYRANLVDNISKPSLEIDGIATKEDKLYVVECKGWRLPPRVEESIKRDEQIRDLQGIVDGVKYTTKNGKRITQKKKSLLEKVEFVNKNMYLWSFERKNFSTIQGLIVIMDYPLISEYKGIKIISVKDIAGL